MKADTPLLELGVPHGREIYSSASAAGLEHSEYQPGWPFTAEHLARRCPPAEGDYSVVLFGTRDRPRYPGNGNDFNGPEHESDTLKEAHLNAHPSLSG
jgi:hypothetical protein